MDLYGLIAFLAVLFVASQGKILSLLRLNRLKAVMIFEMQIEDQLSDIIRETCVDRALFCKLHNGGGRITIGAEKKISVLCEPEGSLEPHTKDAYVSYPVDRQYRSVLIEMLEARSVFVYHQVDRLPYGILRRKTEADKITATLHYFIRESKSGGYFVFLGTTNDPNELLGRPDQHNYIEEKIQAIRILCDRACRKKILK